MSKSVKTSGNEERTDAYPIRILIADDHPVVREGLRTVLDKPGLAIVGEASTGAEAVVKAAALDPDVILLDIRMPEMDGLQALKAIKASNPGISIVILTTYESNEYLWSAIVGGAAGYVLKGASASELADIICRVASGEMVLDPVRLQEMVTQFGKASGPESGQPPEEGLTLTEKERRILGLLANGMKNQDIAEQLGVSLATVKSHINHLFHKINVSGRTQAAIWAFQHARLLTLAVPDKT